MEFLQFESHVPDGTSESEIKARYSAEAAASAKLAREGHLVRLGRPPGAPARGRHWAYTAPTAKEQLDGLLSALPLHEWMQVTVTPLEPHPSDPS